MKVALDRLSRSLHSDVCDSDGCRDAVAHSRISGRGSRRSRAAPNHNENQSHTTTIAQDNVYCSEKQLNYIVLSHMEADAIARLAP